MKLGSITRRRLMDALSRPLVNNRILARIVGAKFAPFDMIFTDVWRQYLLDHSGDIDGKLDELCKGLDETSVELAHAVSTRYFQIAPLCAYGDAVRYRTDLLFSAYEKELQVDFGKRMRLREKEGYLLPKNRHDLSISVFASHNGLDFIPDAHDRLRGGVFIDGGAFIGDSALVMNKFEPRAIFCFEPDAANRKLMEYTIVANKLDKVTVVGCGLGGHQATAHSAGEGSQTKLFLTGNGGGEGGVPITTVECFCADQNFQPDLIKLDVEGMEFDVIMGARSIIASCKPVLIISIYHTPRDFFDIKPLLLSIRPDYKMMIRRLSPFHPTNETVLIAY